MCMHCKNSTTVNSTTHRIASISDRESKNMLEKVAAIIREQLNQENVEITEATRFKEDLEVDSLDLFELVMVFEEEYGVSIPSEELENMATVGDVIRYIQEHA